MRASELAGIDTVPAFVLPLDRDRAIITLVDSNIQRENILPSERAFAYKMKLEAMKRQGFRTDLTSSQVGTKLRTDDMRRQDNGTAVYPPYGTDTADFADGGRRKNRPYPCCGTLLFTQRGTGKTAYHDGKRGSNALSFTGTADEKP